MSGCGRLGGCPGTRTLLTLCACCCLADVVVQMVQMVQSCLGIIEEPCTLHLVARKVLLPRMFRKKSTKWQTIKGSLIWRMAEDVHPLPRTFRGKVSPAQLKPSSPQRAKTKNVTRFEIFTQRPLRFSLPQNYTSGALETFEKIIKKKKYK